MAKDTLSLIGGIAFLIGIIIAIIFAFLNLVIPGFQITSLMAVILVIIGIVVGLLNITHKESTPFLMSGAVLIIAASLGKDIINIIHSLGRFLDYLLLIFVPATIIVAVRNVFSLARD